MAIDSHVGFRPCLRSISHDAWLYRLGGDKQPPKHLSTSWQWKVSQFILHWHGYQDGPAHSSFNGSHTRCSSEINSRSASSSTEYLCNLVTTSYVASARLMAVCTSYMAMQIFEQHWKMHAARIKDKTKVSLH